MIASPTNVLLADICARIAQYFIHWPQPVDCAVHDGRFAPDELDRFVVRAPAVRVAALAAADALDSGGEPGGGELVTIDLRLAAVAIAADSPGTSRGEAARALADRIMYGIALESAWRPAAGDPREIRAGNLYNGKLDASKAIALWAVSWRQQVNARLADFEQVPPDTAELPNTVLAGFTPDVGTAHAADYDTVVVPERSGPAVLRSALAIGPATLAARLVVEAPAPAVLRSAVAIGPATLAARLVVEAPAPAVLRSAVAIGPATLAARLVVEAPAPAVLRSAVAIGPATLAARLVVEAPAPAVLRSAVAIGPATLAARLVVEAPAPAVLRSAVAIGPATLAARLVVEAPAPLHPWGSTRSPPRATKQAGRLSPSARPGCGTRHEALRPWGVPRVIWTSGRPATSSSPGSGGGVEPPWSSQSTLQPVVLFRSTSTIGPVEPATWHSSCCSRAWTNRWSCWSPTATVLEEAT